MKKPVSRRRLFTYSTVLTGLVIASLVVALVLVLMNLQKTSAEVSDLKAQIAKTAKQAEMYKRAYCTNTFEVTHASEVTKYHLTSAGRDRTYQVHTPANYDPSVRYPVVISFDGMEGSGTRIESYSGVDALPVIAVYPDSLPGKRGFTAWEGAPYALDGTQDIQFVKDLLETLPSQYCTDATKTFAVGMSNGGGFAMLTGCYIPDKIRAVASVSGAYYTTCKSKGRLPSLMVVHSTTDKQVPFDGSEKRHLPEITDWVQSEATGRQCQDSVHNSTHPGVEYYNWYGCKDDSQLRYVIVSQQNHGWLTIPKAINKKTTTAGYIWKFFQEVAYIQ